MTVCMRLRWAPPKTSRPQNLPEQDSPSILVMLGRPKGRWDLLGLCQILEMQEGQEKVGAEDPDPPLPWVFMSAEPGEKVPSLWGWS